MGRAFALLIDLNTNKLIFTRKPKPLLPCQIPAVRFIKSLYERTLFLPNLPRSRCTHRIIIDLFQ